MNKIVSGDLCVKSHQITVIHRQQMTKKYYFSNINKRHKHYHMISSLINCQIVPSSSRIQPLVCQCTGINNALNRRANKYYARFQQFYTDWKHGNISNVTRTNTCSGTQTQTRVPTVTVRTNSGLRGKNSHAFQNVDTWLSRKQNSSLYLRCSPLHPSSIHSISNSATSNRVLGEQFRLLHQEKTFSHVLGYEFQLFPRKKTSTCRSQQFHTTPRRNMNPMLWFVIAPAAKLAAFITGRFSRGWWQKQPIHRKIQYFILFSSVWFGGVICYYYYHLQEAPITGRRRFIPFTDDQYQDVASRLTRSICQQYAREELEYDDRRYIRALRILNNILFANIDLIRVDGRKNWVVVVLDRPADNFHINALSNDSGLIILNSGLLEVLTSDDELAFIVAHEMAHILLAHQKEKISQAQIVDFFIIAFMAAIWLIIPSDGISIVTQWFMSKCSDLMVRLPYSRKLEKEADKVGLQLMAKACYDVRAAPLTMTKFHLHQHSFSNDQELGFEFLKTHPQSLKRAKHMDFLVERATEIREACNCSALPKADPRDMIETLTKQVEQQHIKTQTKQNLKKVTTVRHS